VADAVRAHRRFPLAVWLIVALQTLLMLGLAVLYPPFQNPDEVAHVDYVLAHRHGEWLDGPGARHYQSGVLAANAEVPGTQFRAHVGGSPVVPRSERKSFDALGTRTANSPFPDQMVQHPPLYYGAAAAWTYLLPGWNGHRFDIQVFWLRLFSILLLIPVPLLIYAAARRVSEQHGLALVAAILPLSVPSYLRTGASVNNDSLLTLLVTAFIALLVRVAWGDLSGRTAVLVGLAWGGALLTKGFALALPPAIVLAYLVGARGTLRERIGRSWQGFVLAGAVGSVIGAWWWVRNLVVYGVVQPSGFGHLSDDLRQLAFGHDRPGGGEVDFFGNFFGLLARRAWGSLGLIDRPSMPDPLLFCLAIVFLVTLVVAIVLGLRRFAWLRNAAGVPTWSASRASTLVLPSLLILSVMYFGARTTYLHGRQLQGIQVRYLVPALIGLAICTAVTLQALAGRAARWLPTVLLVAGLGFVAMSVYVVLRVEMSSTSPDRVRALKDAVRYVVQWAPFPAAVSGALAVLILATAVATVAILIRDARRAGVAVPGPQDAPSDSVPAAPAR
jgi:4-amino-4-deoxy-L-arabinose transferase-like glycosyltransferase